MKIGVIGAGAVAAASISSFLHVPSADAEIVIIDLDRAKAAGLAEDLTYTADLVSVGPIRAGGYADLAGASLVIVTAGVNEKAGGADDRDDPRGRLKLIPPNAKAYAEIIPAVVQAAPEATLLIVTDPPDPLADLALRLAGHERVVSTGTVIDSLRFRHHIAKRLGLRTVDVQASVVGEHGTSSVFLWSTATVGGAPVLELFERRGADRDEITGEIESAVRFGNITVIEGIGASQHGIGAVVANLADVIIRDERAVLPVASFRPDYGATLGLPSVLGSGGVLEVIEPPMTEHERAGLERSAEILREARKTACEVVGLLP